MTMRNNSIDIFRLICSILVVAIHTHPLKDFNLYLGYFATDILPRIAVPFFFAVSGYYYISMADNAKRKKYLITIIKTYVFWSVIYTFLQLFIYIKNGCSLLGFIYETFIAFFITGSYYHLWYLVALIISILIVTLACKYKLLKPLYILSLILFLLGCLGCSYYNFGLKIPLISNFITMRSFTLIRKIYLMGLPFFLSGYLIKKVEPKFKNLSSRNIAVLFCIVIFTYLSEIYLVEKYNLANNIVVTVLLYPLVVCTILVLLKNPLPDAKQLGKFCKNLSEYIYFIHPLFIYILSNMLGEYLLIESYSTKCFIVVLGFNVLFGICTMKIKSLIKLKPNH